MTRDWQTRPSEGKVEIHCVMDGAETKGWIHTHGMANKGLPELEIRDSPAFLYEASARILLEVCDYMLDSGKAVKAGETMGIWDRTEFRFVKAGPIPGEEGHYDVERLQIVGMECGCDECRLSQSQLN